MSWQPKNTALSAQPRVTRSADCYLSSTRRHQSAHLPRVMQNDHHVVETGQPTGHPAVGIKRQLRPNSSLPHRRQTLDSRAGHTRSIYRSRGRFHTRDDSYLFGRDKLNHTRANNHRRTSSEIHRDTARYRGAAHPLCFTEEVLDHEFPEGFKPVNIESYDGTTDPQCGPKILFSTSTWPEEMTSTLSNTSG